MDETLKAKEEKEECVDGAAGVPADAAAAAADAAAAVAPAVAPAVTPVFAAPRIELLRARGAAVAVARWSALLLAPAATLVLYARVLRSDALLLVGAVVSVVLVALFHLLAAWFVSFRRLVYWARVRSLAAGATHAAVFPPPHAGRAEICEIHVSADADGANPCEWFAFQRRRFVYDRERGAFASVDASLAGLTFGDCLAARGHGSDGAVERARRLWGDNRFEIPVPAFLDLYKEHLLAPFFVFQMFCLLLWLLDEYWYYSLVTLVLLLIVEGTVVKMRQRNLGLLRSMGQGGCDLWVYRGGRWRKHSSDELVPFDLCSVKRGAVPCDMVILAGGSCIVDESLLTGESAPRLKERCDTRAPGEPVDFSADSVHVLFGGTRIVQQRPDRSSRVVSPPPDGGCVAVVVRTGFYTAQGTLLRTILFSTEQVTANTRETGLFILFLLLFAVAASGYVLFRGLEDATRSRYKLVLNCLMIVTAVVPPELPMELSLAVNSSLQALAKLAVFCTEPFRIPFAGRVSICCFDKTGTLTSDDVSFLGVATDAPELARADELPESARRVLGACHGLVAGERGEITGDPMELAALRSLRWNFTPSETVIPASGRDPKLVVLHRFHFSSSLKRMSSVVETVGGTERYILAKGAPETLRDFLDPATLPVRFEETYRHFARLGCRVLALGSRALTRAEAGLSREQLRRTPRAELERSLEYAGLAVFRTPLKRDSRAAISAIRRSSHKCCIVTGDAVLTACHVARELEIATRPFLVLESPTPVGGGDGGGGCGGSARWVSLDRDVEFPVAGTALPRLLESWDLALSGAPGALDAFLADVRLRPHLVDVAVFARVSPQQKETVVATLAALGQTTLMCGDGTNDVGGLKRAHVGVAVLNQDTDAPPPRRRKAAPPARKDSAVSGRGGGSATAATSSSATPPALAARRGGAPGRAAAGGGGAGAGRGGKPRASRSSSGSKPTAPRDVLKAALEEAEVGATIPQLGDASFASPFTSKGKSIGAVAHIIRQGRCTLVATHQMFRILAVNCLVTAYSLSILHLDGVKFGDAQMTVVEILVALCFLTIARTKPLPTLSVKRPHSSVFSLYTFGSILGQFVIHLACLVHIVRDARRAAGGADVGGTLPADADPDGDFAPNLVNTAVFLLAASVKVSTFAINYRGHPFMQSLRENRPLLAVLCVFCLGTLFLAARVNPQISEALELVDYTPEFQKTLLLTIGADFLGCLLLEKACYWLLY